MERKLLGRRYTYDGKAHYKLNDVQIKAKQRVEERINSGEYHFETYACECGSKEDSFRILAEKDRYGFKVQTVICKNCGLMMTNPRMTQEAYNLFYDSEYRKIYLGVESANDVGENFFASRKGRGRKIAEFVGNEVGESIKSVLEIGCSAGAILEAFKEKGCKVKGIDLGGEYIEYGKKRGLDLEQCASAELLKRDEKYDLIILSHVFEHFLDIESELKVIRNLLNDSGVLYLEVPGVLSISKTYASDFLSFLQNAHIYHFTLHSLQDVMARYGWEMVKGNEGIRSLFRPNKSVSVENRNEYFFIMKQLKRMEFYRPMVNAYLYIEQKIFSIGSKLIGRRN